MKTISDILRNNPVWVNPNHAIEAAIVLMRSFELHGLPVLEGEEIVGIVTECHLMGIEKHKRVADVMESQFVTLSLATSVREAAETMIREKMRLLPVVRDDGTLAGMLSESDLLADLRCPVDPITELHWSDSLREWAIEQLQAAHEISLLFIDIDDFGRFNKRHGHVVGDAVLKNVANVLSGMMDHRVDIVCRYGGDEFCIATLRNAIEASAMAEIVERSVAEISLPDIPDLSIAVTVGQHGGKRHREREHTHYVATLNNLINLASRDCILKKATRRSVEASALDANTMLPLTQTAVVETQGRDVAVWNETSQSDAEVVAEETPTSPRRSFLDGLRLSSLGVTRSNGVANVRVELERGRSDQSTASTLTRENFTGDVSGQEEGDSLRRVVAEATVDALRQALPSGYDIGLSEVLAAQTVDGRQLITVAGVFVTPTDSRPIAGSVFSGADPNRAVAAAVLSAANRQLARLPFPSSLSGK